MYRITVTTKGRNNNIALCSRYCLFKKSAKKIIKVFTDEGCFMKVEKLTRFHGDIFGWTDLNPNDSVYIYYCGLYKM